MRLKRFHSTGLSEITIHEISKRYVRGSWEFARNRTSEITSPSLPPSFPLSPFRPSLACESKNAKFHGAPHAEIMVNAGELEKNGAMSFRRRMQYPFKGNLLSAQLRARRNSCKWRIDSTTIERGNQARDSARRDIRNFQCHHSIMRETKQNTVGNNDGKSREALQLGTLGQSERNESRSCGWTRISNKTKNSFKNLRRLSTASLNGTYIHSFVWNACRVGLQVREKPTDIIWGFMTIEYYKSHRSSLYPFLERKREGSKYWILCWDYRRVTWVENHSGRCIARIIGCSTRARWIMHQGDTRIRGIWFDIKPESADIAHYSSGPRGCARFTRSMSIAFCLQCKWFYNWTPGSLSLSSPLSHALLQSSSSSSCITFVTYICI